jgi:hypothetical protein
MENVGISWRVWERKMLVYVFMAICKIKWTMGLFSRFGTMRHEKSGNPDSLVELRSTVGK